MSQVADERPLPERTVTETPPSPTPSPSPKTVLQLLSDTFAEYGQVQFNIKAFKVREAELEAQIRQLDVQIQAGAK